MAQYVPMPVIAILIGHFSGSQNIDATLFLCLFEKFFEGWRRKWNFHRVMIAYLYALLYISIFIMLRCLENST